jgi:hypothetical protein
MYVKEAEPLDGAAAVSKARKRAGVAAAAAGLAVAAVAADEEAAYAAASLTERKRRLGLRDEAAHLAIEVGASARRALRPGEPRCVWPLVLMLVRVRRVS